MIQARTRGPRCMMRHNLKKIVLSLSAQGISALSIRFPVFICSRTRIATKAMAGQANRRILLDNLYNKVAALFVSFAVCQRTRFLHRSRDFFPKASAKVRTFCGLTKYLRHFFAASKHFSRFDDQGQRRTPFYLFAREKEGRNKGKEQERSSGGDASGQRAETGARRNGENGGKGGREGRNGEEERNGEAKPRRTDAGGRKHDTRTQAGENMTHGRRRGKTH